MKFCISLNGWLYAIEYFKRKIMETTRKETVEYKGRTYRVQNSKGWRHIVLTENGKRTLIGVSQIERERLQGQSMPMYFNYVFGFGFRDRPNAVMDAYLLKN